MPPEELRLGRVPEANGGRLRRDLPLPDVARFAVARFAVARFAVEVPEPGSGSTSATGTVGEWLAELVRATADRRDFRVVCPDELESNKLGALLEATDQVELGQDVGDEVRVGHVQQGVQIESAAV